MKIQYLQAVYDLQLHSQSGPVSSLYVHPNELTRSQGYTFHLIGEEHQAQTLSQEYIRELTVNGIHDLQASIRIPVPQTFKDELEIR